MADPENSALRGHSTVDEDEARGRRLAKLMQRGGWDKADLAKAIGRNRGQVYRALDGKPLRSETIGLLAEALETTRSYIMTGQEEHAQIDRIEQQLSEVARAVGAPLVADAAQAAGQVGVRQAVRDRLRSASDPDAPPADTATGS